MPTAAVDFETYYDKELSIGIQGTYHYLRAPKSDIYLVSIAATNGLQYVGHPKDFDWSQISGPDWTWLSHNAQFDLPVFERLVELGVGNTQSVTELEAWHDTADLAAYLGIPRSLKMASATLLGKKLSKDVRDQMKGRTWESMDPAFKKEVMDYALSDAESCLEIWVKFGGEWPYHERGVSTKTREMCMRGVPMDLPGLDADIEKLEVDLWDTRQLIPWKDAPHRTASKAKKGETIALLSSIALREECIKNGLVPPTSFAQEDPEAERFFEEYGDKFPWIRAVRDYRKAGKHLGTLKTMRSRMKDDGFMPYGLKYAGAHTLRDSGDSGLNMQNLPKGVVCGVDVRAKIKAPPGYVLGIADLSQIEPRCLHWLAEDEKTLAFIRIIPDLYEAQARAWGLYNKEGVLSVEDPDLRFLMKKLALGLGYGMGVARFFEVSGLPMLKCEELVALYRKLNRPVTGLWKKLDAAMETPARHATDKLFQMVLPSGRIMNYRNVARINRGLTAEIPRNGKYMRLPFWGGILTENLVQATARDVFMHHCMEVERAGFPVTMRVHDEVVCLLKEETAEDDLKQILGIMSTPPEWAVGLPLAADGKLSDVYRK